VLGERGGYGSGLKDGWRMGINRDIRQATEMARSMQLTYNAYKNSKHDEATRQVDAADSRLPEHHHLTIITFTCPDKFMPEG